MPLPIQDSRSLRCSWNDEDDQGSGRSTVPESDDCFSRYNDNVMDGIMPPPEPEPPRQEDDSWPR